MNPPCDDDLALPTGPDSSLPPCFDTFLPDSIFRTSSAAMKSSLLDIVKPLGIKHLKLGQNAHKNKDPASKENFPHSRFSWICGSCSAETKQIPADQPGCCGFKVRCYLDRQSEPDPVIVIREFSLPPTSLHFKVDSSVWAKKKQIPEKQKGTVAGQISVHP